MKTLPGSRRTLEVLSLAVALATIAVTVFFSLRAERSKELTVSFVALRSLLNANPSASGLVITHRGIPVSQPWLVSLRVENSGEIPIERRDIEQALTLSFNRAAIRGVEIAGKTPSDLPVQITFDSTSVTIDHQLLNAGDAFGLDILTDTQPSLPTISARISGVAAIKTVKLFDIQSRSGPTINAFPRPIVFLSLAASTIISVVLTVAGIAMLGDPVRAFAGAGPNAKLRLWANSVTPKDITFTREELGGLEGLEELGSWLSAEYIDRPEHLRDKLSTYPRAALGGHSPGHAADKLILHMRMSMASAVFRNAINKGAIISLHVHSAFAELMDEEVSASDYLGNLRGAIDGMKLPDRGFAAMDGFDLVGAFTLVVTGVLSGLIAGASWYDVLA